VDTNELMPIREGHKWGFKDGAGRTVIPARFEGVGSFAEGLARVKLDGKWGFIDKTGRMVIEAQFEQARFFCDGLAKVKLGEVWGMIEKSGRFVEEIGAETYLDQEGNFISEQEYKDWGKRQDSDE
jgi:hypothetical protein